jgi:hypothetical protein
MGKTKRELQIQTLVKLFLYLIHITSSKQRSATKTIVSESVGAKIISVKISLASKTDQSVVLVAKSI